MTCANDALCSPPSNLAGRTSRMQALGMFTLPAIAQLTISYAAREPKPQAIWQGEPIECKLSACQ